MSLTGGLGNAATVCYKRLASLFSSKREQPYCSLWPGSNAACHSLFFARQSSALEVPALLEAVHLNNSLTLFPPKLKFQSLFNYSFLFQNPLLSCSLCTG